MSTRDILSLGGTLTVTAAIIGVVFAVRQGVYANASIATGRIDDSAVLANSSGEQAVKTSSGDKDSTSLPQEAVAKKNEAPQDKQEEQTLGATTNPTDTNKEDTESDETKPPVLLINFFKKTAEQIGSNIVIDSAIEGAQLDGTCVYTFSLNDLQLTRTNAASAGSCFISLPISALEVPGTWTVAHTYTSANGLLQGSGGEYSVPVAFNPDLPVPGEAIDFTESNAGQDLDAVKIYGQLNAFATDTCIFTFEAKDQTSIIFTEEINESNLCATTISSSQFPVAGTYTSTTTLRSENGAASTQNILTVTI